MFPSIFTDELGMDIVQGLPIIKSWGLNQIDLRARVFGKAAESLEGAQVDELKQLIDKHGMTVGCLESSLAKVHLPDAERRREEEAKLERIIRLADVLDCRLVRTFHYWQPGHEERGELAVRPDEQQKVLDMFAPVAERAKAEGLILAFENCGVTVDEVFTMLDLLNEPSWGIAYDACNSWGEPQCRKDYQAFVRRVAQRAKALHVKAKGAVEGLADFTIPYADVLDICQNVGFDGPVSVETHNPDRSMGNDEMSKKVYDVVMQAWPSAAPGGPDVVEKDKPEITRPWHEDPVGFVVVGLGMGHNRAKQIARTSGNRLVGVCDLVEERAERTGKELDVPYNTDFREWLSNDEVDVIYVVTETGNHAKVALEAMDAGKHVLSTKPMEATLEKSDAMIERARKKGVLYAVDFDKRFADRTHQLREAVQSNAFGKLINASTSVLILRTDEYYAVNGGWHGTWELDGGGVFSNQAVHEIDFLRYTLGSPARVRADIYTANHEIEAEDLGSAVWEYGNGLVVNFHATTCYPQKTWFSRTDVFGTAGAYHQSSGGPNEGSLAWFRDGAWHENAPNDAATEWLNATDNMAAAIRIGAPLACPGECARATQAVLDAMYRSAREHDGGWVALR